MTEERPILSARVYMHRGVEERKRSVGRSVPGYKAGRQSR